MTRSNKEIVRQELRRRILTMAWAPATPLDEISLCAEFDLSRTPMRDILRELAGEGYVHLRENKGAIVAPMDHMLIRSFFQTAPLIYATISRLAAEQARPEQIDALAQIQKNFKQAVADQSVESMVYHNDQFHHHMGVMADNTYLMPSLQRLLIDHARIGQTFWQGQSEADINAMQEASAHHDQFIEVLAAGDGEAAVALTWEHWELSRQHMDRYVRPDPLPIYDEVSVAAS